MRNFLTAVLFWCMTLGGGAVLLPCLLLPAWLDYKGAVADHAAFEAHVEQLRARLARLEKQIEHQKHDPAYNERQLRIELGQIPEGIQTVLLRPSRDAAASDADVHAEQQLVRPELAAWVDGTLRDYPLMRLFVHQDTRPLLMAMSAGLLVSAWVLLGRPVRRTVVPATTAATDA